MRWMAFLLVACGVSACGERESFDQRYERTSERLQNKADVLDAELANDVTNETVSTDNTQRGDKRP